MDNAYYVYILTNKRNGTLYTGVTSNLLKRVSQHKNKYVEGFTKEYNTDRLVYFEQHREPEEAIKREKKLKKWKRKWKLDLIEDQNHEWNDLYEEIIK